MSNKHAIKRMKRLQRKGWNKPAEVSLKDLHAAKKAAALQAAKRKS